MKITAPTVNDLARTYKYQILVGNEESLQKEIKNPDTMIPGLELAGFYDFADFSRGVVIGKKEIVFISRLNKAEQTQCFEFLTDNKIPFIVIGDNMECPKELKNMATKRNIALLLDDKKADLISHEIYSYCISKLARQQSFHGTFIEVYGVGVLLRGASGIGKSEIALELIKRGHHLIADDSVIVYRREHHLYGRCPEHLKSLLEVRGLGLIDAQRLFGITSVLENAELRYIIDLETFEDVNKLSRLDDSLSYEEIIGLKVPKVSLPVSMGRNLADLVEIAVMTLIDRSSGHNTTKEFLDKYDEAVKGEK